MESQQIKPGDVVRLKSGGPDMTIKEISDQTSEDAVACCIWFPEPNESGRVGIRFDMQQATIPCVTLDLVKSARTPEVKRKTALAEQIQTKAAELAPLIDEARKLGLRVEVSTMKGSYEFSHSAKVRVLLDLAATAEHSTCELGT